jgi:DNA-binding transcriptional LysR family regulator
MEMHQIRYFLAVAETLNFTRAAEKCNVTQPALSRAIQSLEDEMGGLLFRRERGLTHLTDLGRLMMPHLEQVLRETEAAKSTARGFLKLEDAPLNLGVMCTIGPLRFGGFLARFRADNPGVELSLMEGSAQMLNGLLQEGRLDVAVMAQPTPYDERYDVRPLYRERFTVGFPAGHRFAQLNAVPMREMSGESYLQRASCEYGRHLGDLCRSHGVELRKAYRSEREDWIQVMIVAGLGVCFLPEFSPIVQGVQTRLVTEPDVVREVSAVTVSGRRFSPAVARFVNAIKAHKWPDEV